MERETGNYGGYVEDPIRSVSRIIDGLQSIRRGETRLIEHSLMDLARIEAYTEIAGLPDAASLCRRVGILLQLAKSQARYSRSSLSSFEMLSVLEALDTIVQEIDTRTLCPTTSSRHESAIENLRTCTLLRHMSVEQSV